MEFLDSFCLPKRNSALNFKTRARSQCPWPSFSWTYSVEFPLKVKFKGKKVLGMYTLYKYIGSNYPTTCAYYGHYVTKCNFKSNVQKFFFISNKYLCTYVPLIQPWHQNSIAQPQTRCSLLQPLDGVANWRLNPIDRRRFPDETFLRPAI